MALKQRSWLDHHLITHHHVIADRLVRVALVVLVVILAVGFAVTRWQNAQIKITMTITGINTAVVKDEQDFIVDMVNNGTDVRDGVQLAIKSSPGITIEAVDNEEYPPDGIFFIQRVQAGGQIRFKVHTTITALGSQQVTAEVRRTTSDRVVTKTTHVVLVEKPELHVAVGAHYYSKEGEQLGRGPLPPKVGEITTYYVTMQIPYEGHAWKTIEVSGVLDTHASWTGFVLDGGKYVRYDPESRRVIWRLDWLTNEIVRDAGASFMVGVTPNMDDVGQVVPLLTDVQVSGITVEGERFATELPAVTTDIKDVAKDQGTCVVEP